jgi:hypothetical protein
MADTPASIRSLLHDVNDELSVAVLELELLLEDAGIDGPARESLAGSVEACRRAADSLRQVWRQLGPPAEDGQEQRQRLAEARRGDYHPRTDDGGKFDK